MYEILKFKCHLRNCTALKTHKDWNSTLSLHVNLRHFQIKTVLRYKTELIMVTRFTALKSLRMLLHKGIFIKIDEIVQIMGNQSKQ